MPLLSAARESSGTVLQTAPGFIAVSWRFPGGTLSLALNISATTVLLPDLPGKTLFASPNESTGSLSQHSLIVRLAVENLHHDPNCNVSPSVSQWHDLRSLRRWCLTLKIWVSAIFMPHPSLPPPASTHGYDVTDANEIEPSIGGREGFERLVAELKAQGLGLIIDIVPNHMASSLENARGATCLNMARRAVTRAISILTGRAD